MKRVSIIIIICFVAGASHTCRAQAGSITVVQDTGIQSVLDLYRVFAKQKRMMDGFRVQLGSGSTRQSLMTLKAKFLQQYSDVGAYVEYQQPTFRLRVGDFKSRGEANEFMDELKDDFVSMFVVPDKIFVEGAVW